MQRQGVYVHDAWWWVASAAGGWMAGCGCERGAKVGCMHRQRSRLGTWRGLLNDSSLLLVGRTESRVALRGLRRHHTKLV